MKLEFSSLYIYIGCCIVVFSKARNWLLIAFTFGPVIDYCILVIFSKGKGKAVPIQAWTLP